ncbi:MAG: aldehyde dehydrogenase family protein [Planctomycetes bacterium]|nr:aldehyde dehydrogenase family protein [Planctomycetota bacterium]
MTAKSALPIWVGGTREAASSSFEVRNKFDGSLIASVGRADAATIERAIDAAVEAAPRMAALAAHEREEILLRIEVQLRARATEFATLLCDEAGKPIRDARNEVVRMIEIFHMAAGEALRQYGEVLPMDVVARGRGRTGLWTRVPVGACSFITPFNFPLNLVAHKVAPAIAVGCPFVLKPASLTPLSALLLGEVFAEAGMPAGSFSILPCERSAAALFTTDPRLNLLSFTGSPDVGWDLKSRAGKKKVVLELGGNAACIVEPDWDVSDAVERILIGAYANSGQSCIKTQRLLVHASRYEAVRDALVQGSHALVVGDPRSEATHIGPLITEGDAVRLERWTRDAVAHGARLLCGGTRQGACFAPTVLENVAESDQLCCDEAFGPVVVLSAYTAFEEALSRVNRSRFGLQAGIFTRDWSKIRRAFDALEVGGVIIGDTPSFRIDHMPYGGVKDSGLGREGLRFAMEDMTEIRMLVLRDHP